MFNESWPWKRELGICAARLRKVAQEETHQNFELAEDEWESETEEIFAIERDVMVGCFALRRLLGMPYKVTQEIRKRTVQVTVYPLREDRSAPDYLDAVYAFDLYDFTKPTSRQITTQQMCNLFIHSHVFHLAWDLTGMSIEEARALEENDPRLNGPIRLGGFYVTTDQSKDQLIRLELETLTSRFEEMSLDELNRLHARRDSRGKWKIVEANRAQRESEQSD
ncbi:hypothetical protein [Corynebacterium xerosis]|uniref:Uncharacterized protein n=1 Tax=Corynebacterium xerosis TaxID=1725 RepID=A0ABV3UY64_9CORY